MQPERAVCHAKSLVQVRSCVRAHLVRPLVHLRHVALATGQVKLAAERSDVKLLLLRRVDGIWRFSHLRAYLVGIISHTVGQASRAARTVDSR